MTTKLHTPTAAEKKHAIAAETMPEAEDHGQTADNLHGQTADKLKDAREVLMRHFASKELVDALEEFIRAIK